MARKLLELAESGDLEGIAFVCKFGAHDHRAGVAGDYKRHPEQALEALLMLKQELIPTGRLLFRESAT